MSFREKSAWITFILVLGVFGIYFLNFGLHYFSPAQPHFNDFHLFFGLIVAIIVLEVVLHAIAAVRSPQEANTPQDERERLITLKATRPAFFVLMAGTLMAIGTIHLGAGAWLLMHSVLFAIWIAQLTRYGAQVYYYRCDA